MEGDASDKGIACMLQRGEADGPYYHQEREGMVQTTPTISGGMNALRLPAFFEILSHGESLDTLIGGNADLVFDPAGHRASDRIWAEGPGHQANGRRGRNNGCYEEGGKGEPLVAALPTTILTTRAHLITRAHRKSPPTGPRTRPREPPVGAAASTFPSARASPPIASPASCCRRRTSGH